MANISDFAAIFDCTIWRYLGRDVYGNASFDAPVFLSKEIYYTATNSTFIDSKGDELVAKYKIITSADNIDSFHERDYIALGEDLTSEPDPIQAGAHEIKSVNLVKVPFAGLADEVIIMV